MNNKQGLHSGQASKPAIIQTHLKKLFAGIFNVNFDEEERHIMTMNSIEGEIVPLKRKIRISAEVSDYFHGFKMSICRNHFFIRLRAG